MGLIAQILSLVFGENRNVLVETSEVFRENAEAGAQRASSAQAAAMAQFGAEFRPSGQGRFDRFMDGVNRLPRPTLALGTLALFLSAMFDPLWFAERMQGVALVPEPLWWLLGVIVSFYFGARHQAKSQQFRRDLASTIRLAPTVMENLTNLRTLHDLSPGAASTGTDAALSVAAGKPDPNPALEAWRRTRQTRDNVI